MKRTGNVARLRNAAQRRALEQAKRVPWPRLASLGDSDWDRLRVGFFQLNAFCQWMDLMLDVQDRRPDRLSRELLSRYPGFSLADRRIAPKDAAKSLKSWVLSHGLPGANEVGVSAALRFHLRNHPEYAATRAYAQLFRVYGQMVR